MDSNWDCVVIGGGAAGLSAGLVLGRARKQTLVVDTGAQSNLAAPGIGGLLGHNERPPAELYAAGREEISAHPAAELRDVEVTGAERAGDELALTFADGSRGTTRRILLATGMEYRYPEIPGIAERWGRSAFHCPFCHGWEVRDRVLGVLDPGPGGARRALLLRSWSEEVTLFTNGAPAPDAADAELLQASGIEVEERPVAELRGNGEALEAVAFSDGGERSCEALLVAVTLHQRTTLPEQLGLELAEPGGVVVDGIKVDPIGAASVPGVFAAGDASAHMPSVANSIAAGSVAAAGVVHSLM